MNKQGTSFITGLLALTLLSLFQHCSGQKSFGTEFLQLENTIPIPGIKGRIDHIDVDPVNKIAYLAALGNNTLEVIDLQKGITLHSISGLDEPQGVAWVSKTKEIFVANGGNGECYFYNANNYQKSATIKLESDADDVRYDLTSNKIYVGYGKGGIAVIDAGSHQQVGDVKLPAHPESFQLDIIHNRIYANIPDANLIAVIDLNKLSVITSWHRMNLSSNFPMAIDSANQEVIVGYRSPATLEINNVEGHSLFKYPMVNDADDLYYDEIKKRVYVSGGGGTINVFQREDSGNYKQIANIETRHGARTSFFIAELQLYLVAARAGGGKDAALMVYRSH